MRVLTVALAFLALSCASAFSNRDARIAGGDNAQIESYPYQASIQHNGESVCGGAIISSKYIVTAATCFGRFPNEEMKVLVGSEKTNEGPEVAIGTITLHPKFEERSSRNDIAIVELASEIELNAKSKPIALADSGSDPSAGVTAVVTGYGTVGNSEKAAEQLQKLEVRVVGREDCQNIYEISAEITKEMVCASAAESKGSCERDGGNPLNSAGTLIGISSFGLDCGGFLPEVYTNIGAVRDFIRQVAGV